MSKLGYLVTTLSLVAVFTAGYFVGNIKPTAPEFVPIGIHSAYIDGVGDVMCFDELGFGNLTSYILTLGEEFK